VEDEEIMHCYLQFISFISLFERDEEKDRQDVQYKRRLERDDIHLGVPMTTWITKEWPQRMLFAEM